MSEGVQNIDTGPDVTPVEAPPTSYGTRLRWERERAGLTVNDVAARLRLHPKQIRAIENEKRDALPEATYVRGFVRSYARVLGVEPAPLLADLAVKLGPEASVVDGMARPREYSPVRAAAHEHTSRSLVIVGAVVLLVVLGMLGWFATRPASNVVSSASRPPTPKAAVPAAIPTPAPQPEPAATARSEPPAPTEPPVTPEPVALAPLLKLRFNGPSWVEVKDAEGKVLFSQHSVAGSEQVIEGTPPFYVVIGDAPKVVVEVRGESYDVAHFTRQNVARFTIN